MTLQKAGGIAAIVAALTFIFAFAVVALVIAPAQLGPAAADPGRHLAFLTGHPQLMYSVNAVGYLLFGAALAVVVLALDERLAPQGPALSRLALVFGMVWVGLMFAAGMVGNIGAKVLIQTHAVDPAAAAASWPAYRFVVNGLGGGNELVGGLWLLLVAIAIARSAALPRPLGWLGMATGVAGIATILPPLEDAGAIFGLGLILWFGWAGLALMRKG